MAADGRLDLRMISGAGAAPGDILVWTGTRAVWTSYADIVDGAYLPGYGGVVQAHGPALYLRLGEASGTTAVDSSGNGRDGFYVGPPTLGVTGLLVGDADTCVTFNGSSSERAVVAYASWMDTATLTVEAVVQTSSNTGYPQIINRDDGFGVRDFQFRLEAGTGKLQFIVIGGTSVTATGISNVSDGTPHHVAATFDGSDICLYVDGALEATQACGTALAQSAAQFLVGINNSAGYVGPWDGEIDEVAFYTTALTSGQIAAHFAATGL